MFLTTRGGSIIHYRYYGERIHLYNSIVFWLKWGVVEATTNDFDGMSHVRRTNLKNLAIDDDSLADGLHQVFTSLERNRCIFWIPAANLQYLDGPSTM